MPTPGGRQVEQAPSITVEEEQGIYRGEVIEMMGALADIKVALADITVAVMRILRYIEDDDEWEEEEEDPGAG